MGDVDTSAEAVERLAQRLIYGLAFEGAATLRALVAERDAARLKLAETEHYADQIRAERDAAIRALKEAPNAR